MHLGFLPRVSVRSWVPEVWLLQYRGVHVSRGMRGAKLMPQS